MPSPRMQILERHLVLGFCVRSRLPRALSSPILAVLAVEFGPFFFGGQLPKDSSILVRPCALTGHQVLPLFCAL